MILESEITELHLLNMLIGLCRPCKRWPQTLRQLGYELFGIEVPFTNSDGDLVKPDVILFCRANGHALVIECKSGSYVKENQIRHYPRISNSDLIGKALMPVGDNGNLERDVMVFCLSSRASNIQIDLEKQGWLEPVVGVNEKAIVLHMNRFCDEQLNAEFAKGIELRKGDRPPLHFLPFSGNGSVSSTVDVARAVFPIIVSLSRRGQTIFTLSELTQELMGDLWSFISSEEQATLRSRVRQVLSEAMKTELKRLIKYSKDSPEVAWEICTGKFSSLLATYRNLAQQVEHFIKRLEERRSYEPSGRLAMDIDDWQEEFMRRQRRENHRKADSTG